MKKKRSNEQNFKVTHVDSDGNVIPDLSKVILPLDMSRDLYRIILRSRERRSESEGTQFEK